MTEPAAPPSQVIRITEPGIYDAIPDSVYHADPVDPISVSSGILKLMDGESAAHARLAHPKLNPAFEAAEEEKFDKGKAAHQLLLEPEVESIAVIEHDSWRTNAAKDARDRARNNGQIPMLRADYDDAVAMAEAARAQLAAHRDAADAFTAGKAEQTMVWREETAHGDVMCRARLDWLPEDGATFYDHKTTAASARPDQWGQRTLFDTGAHIQAAFYRRGIKALLRVQNPSFRFVVQENFAPFALSVVEMSQGGMDLARDSVERALQYWGWCLHKNRWPGYASRVAYIDAPIWRQKEFIDQQTRYAIDQDQGLNPYEFGLEFWKPALPAAKP